jgi:hypothetical protein
MDWVQAVEEKGDVEAIWIMGLTKDSSRFLAHGLPDLAERARHDPKP